MKWIDRQDRFDEAASEIAAQPVIAVDTEADSLHSYFDKVCLIQISNTLCIAGVLLTIPPKL